MRIAFILDSFNGGGKERRCLNLIKGLNHKGYNNIMVILINNGIAYEDLNKCNVHIVICDRKKNGSYKTLKFLFKTLNQFSPDVIQTWGIALSSIYINLYRISHRFRYIGAYVANSREPKGLFSLINKINILFMDFIVGNSKAGLKAYNIPLKKQKLIYNGYTNNQSSPNKNIKFELGINTEHIVTMVANMSSLKDYNTYITASKEIIKYRNDITFLCVGGGPDVDLYRTMLSEQDSKFVKILGRRSDVDAIISISDIGVLCSYTEGIPNSIMEFMAQNKPVIVTIGGGTPELVNDSINGYLIKQKDKDKLINKIITLIDNRDLRLELGINGKNKIDNKFNNNLMVNSFLELYN